MLALPVIRTLAVLLGLGAALCGTTMLGIQARRSLTPKSDSPAADGFTTPTPLLVAEGLRWKPESPTGTRALAQAERLVVEPSHVGPFAIRVALEPRATNVRLTFRSAGGGEAVLIAPGLTLMGSRWSFRGGVRVLAPQGRQLLGKRMEWEEGSPEIRATDGFELTNGDGARRIGPRLNIDPWLRNGPHGPHGLHGSIADRH